MKGRTIILVSHHVQLCSQGAAYIVALDNGRVQFEGNRESFQKSGVLRTLVQSGVDDKEPEEEPVIEEVAVIEPESPETEPDSETSSTLAASTTVAPTVEKKAPRKLVKEEQRAVGRVSWDVWSMYLTACGLNVYWTIFFFVFVIAALSPVVENGWLKYVFGSFLSFL